MVSAGTCSRSTLLFILPESFRGQLYHRRRRGRSTKQHLLYRNRRWVMRVRHYCLCFGGGVEGMTGDALGHDFSRRTVTRDAVCLCRHKNIGGLTTLHGVMAIVALYTRVLGMIEIGSEHPAIDQDWFCDGRRGVATLLHVVTKRAT